MSYAALIRSMAEAGAPIEAIVMAVEALEARDAEAAAKRAKVTARKRAQRDRERDSHATVTGHVTDSHAATPFPSPPNENNLTPPAHTPVNTTPRARPDTRLPADWQPEPLVPGSPTAEIVATWEPGRLERELAKFRDHYRAAPGARGMARDWQAKWRTWITNADRFESPNRHGKPHLQPSASSARGARPDPALDMLRAAQAAQRSPDHWGDHREAGASLPAIWRG